MKYREATRMLGYDAIESFDFESVAALMKINNWRWMGAGDTPTVDELKCTVDNLMYHLAENDRPNTLVGTGGFTVYRFIWDTAIEVKLAFNWKSISKTQSLKEI